MGAFSLIVVINLLNRLFVVVTKMMMDYMSPSSLESVAGAAAAMSDLAPLSCNNYSEPGRTNTLNPAVTGASVVAVKYDSGVLIAADTLGSYGSMAKLRDVSRLYQVNDQVAVGFAGDLADAQFITKIISSMVLDDQIASDGTSMSPKAMLNWLTRVYYNRRTKIDPLWNQVVVAGFDKQSGQPLLGCVNLLGYSWQDPVVATGMGAHFALPYIRQRIDAKKAPLTLDEAHEVIKMSMNTLYARDARSWPVYEVIKCDASGVVKSEKQTTDIVWKPYADYQQGRKH